MVASYLKTLKSSVNFTNISGGTYEAPQMTASICLDNECVADDVVPSTREIRIRGSEFKFFVSDFRKLEEIIIKNRE